jgi:hypothetical protein
MRLFFFSLLAVCSLFSKDKAPKAFHKTVAQIEAYKEKDTLRFKPGCVKRLSRNLLTPIHKRKIETIIRRDTHIIKKSSTGPLTVKFLLPLSLKKSIMSLLARNKLILSIPFADKTQLQSTDVEIDRYASPPKGLFAMRCLLDTDLLSPAQIVFIHLLGDEI